MRLSEFNALRGIFHHLKDKMEELRMARARNTTAQQSGDARGQMMTVQCSHTRDMIKSDQCDTRPGALLSSFLGWLCAVSVPNPQ